MLEFSFQLQDSVLLALKQISSLTARSGEEQEERRHEGEQDKQLKKKRSMQGRNAKTDEKLKDR